MGKIGGKYRRRRGRRRENVENAPPRAQRLLIKRVKMNNRLKSSARRRRVEAKLSSLRFQTSDGGGELFRRRLEAAFVFPFVKRPHFVERGPSFELRRRRRLIDEATPVQVVGFVLNNARLKPFPAVGLESPLQVDRLELDFVGAFDRNVKLGEAEAAFVAVLAALALANRRVDKDLFLFLNIPIARLIEDDELVRQLDLVRREPDAFELVHQLEHLGDNVAKALVDLAERLAAIGKDRMRIFCDAHSGNSPNFIYNY